MGLSRWRAFVRRPTGTTVATPRPGTAGVVDTTRSGAVDHMRNGRIDVRNGCIDLTERRNHRGIEAGRLFDLLSNDVRRYALHYLAKRKDPTSLGELADIVERMEGSHSAARYEHLYASLHHAHLPRLVEAGVVTYDPDAELVVATPAVRQFAAYLELAEPDDL